MRHPDSLHGNPRIVPLCTKCRFTRALVQGFKRTGVGTSSPWLIGQRPSLAGVAVAPLGWTALGLSGDAAAGSAVRSGLVSHAPHGEMAFGEDMDRSTCISCHGACKHLSGSGPVLPTP